MFHWCDQLPAPFSTGAREVLSSNCSGGGADGGSPRSITENDYSAGQADEPQLEAEKVREEGLASSTKMKPVLGKDIPPGYSAAAKTMTVAEHSLYLARFWRDNIGRFATNLSAAEQDELIVMTLFRDVFYFADFPNHDWKGVMLLLGQFADQVQPQKTTAADVVDSTTNSAPAQVENEESQGRRMRALRSQNHNDIGFPAYQNSLAMDASRQKKLLELEALQRASALRKQGEIDLPEIRIRQQNKINLMKIAQGRASLDEMEKIEKNTNVNSITRHIIKQSSTRDSLSPAGAGKGIVQHPPFGPSAASRKSVTLPLLSCSSSRGTSRSRSTTASPRIGEESPSDDLTPTALHQAASSLVGETSIDDSLLTTFFDDDENTNSLSSMINRSPPRSPSLSLLSTSTASPSAGLVFSEQPIISETIRSTPTSSGGSPSPSHPTTLLSGSAKGLRSPCVGSTVTSRIPQYHVPSIWYQHVPYNLAQARVLGLQQASAVSTCRPDPLQISSSTAATSSNSISLSGVNILS
ncbi:unnamed protein product, partial [Amoebophrya sp. A25]|eukprot:GSA25T00004328001.1